MCHQQIMNALLRHRMVTQCLAHIHTLGLGRNLVQHFLADQAVMHHHVGAAQPVQRTQGHQIQRAGPGPHDVDKTCRL